MLPQRAVYCNASRRLMRSAPASIRVADSAPNAKPVITPDIPNILKNVKPKLLIDGQFVDAVSGKTFPVVDPRTEETIIQIAEADAEDVNRAVAAARKAFDEGPWPKMSGRARGRLMLKFADLLEESLEELAQLETLGNGKPLTVSRTSDIPNSIDHIRYFASWADKLHGKTIPVDGDYFAYTLREPKGVVGQIIPWNFPLLMMAWKIGPALAAGNTIVLKCAEQTPLTALRAAELALEAGVPPGVLNVLPGYGPTAGAALASHLDVDKIAFTGSTEIGQKIMQMASVNVKDITLELGGKSPLIVFPDADMEKAVEIAHRASFANHGQVCTSGSRVFVHSSVYDEFIGIAANIAKNKYIHYPSAITTLQSFRVVGDPFDEVEQGPQIDRIQFEKILGYIESGQEQGAELICGGSRIGNKGYYIEPTVFGNVQDEMKIAREEIFGPVQSIFKFDDTEEAICRANDTTYGLAAGVLSQNIDTVNRVSRALRAGTMWTNCYFASDHSLPVGGYKMSGIGREKGERALDLYTQTKTVVSPLVNPAWI